MHLLQAYEVRKCQVFFSHLTGAQSEHLRQASEVRKCEGSLSHPYR